MGWRGPSNGGGAPATDRQTRDRLPVTLPPGAGHPYIPDRAGAYHLLQDRLTVATIVDGKKRIPFMRGMLVHHLIERGFDHDEAYDLADALRGLLRDRKSVTRKEILGLIHRLLAERNAQHQVGDLLFWERRPTAIHVARGGGTRPFSKELLSHSIQASGLPPDQAYQVAADIEASLIDERRSRIDQEELQDLVEAAMSENSGPTYAERYRVWRAWGAVDRPLLILIGGASGVGKTSLAIGLANLLDIPRVVATDDIRQALRLTLAPEFMPSIHTSSYTAGSMLQAAGQGPEDRLIAGFREQARVVNVGVQAILGRCVEEKTSVIIDGVHLLPGLADVPSLEENAFLVPLCLSLEDRAAYEARFAKREAESPARSSHWYLSRLDDILRIQEYIVQSCAEADIPVLDTNAVEDLTSAAALVVVEKLQDQEVIQSLVGGNGKKKKKKKGK